MKILIECDIPACYSAEIALDVIILDSGDESSFMRNWPTQFPVNIKLQIFIFVLENFE